MCKEWHLSGIAVFKDFRNTLITDKLFVNLLLHISQIYEFGQYSRLKSSTLYQIQQTLKPNYDFSTTKTF